MSINNSFIFPTLPLVIPHGTRKLEENEIISNVIASFFWKRLESAYEVEKVKVKKYRTKLGSLFETYKPNLLKVENYTLETSFFKFLRKGFSEKVFYRTNKISEKKLVEFECRVLKGDSNRLHREIWLGVLKDVKDNLSSDIYKNFLSMYLPLYILLIKDKDLKLELDIFELLPISKSQINNLLIIQYLPLEDIKVREIVVRKIDAFILKKLDLSPLIIWMIDNNIRYPEFEKYTDIYKNFDTGFTNTIKSEKSHIEKITINIDNLEKNFPLLFKGKKYEKYNKLMMLFLTVLEDFNINILLLEQFNKEESDFYFIVNGEAKINGVPIVEITEEILLFIAEKYNRNLNFVEIKEQAKIYTQSLVLELSIPKNDIIYNSSGIKF